MTTTPEQIDLWRQSPSEHQRLEFMEAKTQFDNRKLYEYCVALANEGGGHLVLGVADKPPRPVVDTQAFRNPTAVAEKLFQALGFRVASRGWCILADEHSCLTSPLESTAPPTIKTGTIERGGGHVRADVRQPARS